MNQPATQPNMSLRRKSAARTAAVQCVYKALVMEETLNAQRAMKEYLEQLKEPSTEKDEERLALPAEPDKKQLAMLLEGVAEHFTAIEKTLETILKDSWKKERMSPLLLAILFVAIYELEHHRSLRTPIVINEYVTLAQGFFPDAEVGFVNAALEKLAKALRPEGHAGV